MDDIGLALITIMICSSKVAGKNNFPDRNRTCVPAEAEPLLHTSQCYPLVNFSRPFCQNHGITLPSYVYSTPSKQIKRNYQANINYDNYLKMDLPKMSIYYNMDISFAKKCVENTIILFCHTFFPSCDRTQSVFRKRMVCRESCLELSRSCGRAWTFGERLIEIRHPDDIEGYKGANCESPYRNAGDSPECWYFNRYANIQGTPSPLELPLKADCLYLNGSNYHGDISMTASGIPCQSWTEQCPHRHTMNITYPELNDAKNYCRNPQNSGKRPWCFTTDRNKRWEHCDIPKCMPVDGGYGNWSLNRTCNATCGQGLEIWLRTCNNPEPKYGGRNCSHLGKNFALKRCSVKPCPVNGGYGNWSLSMKCNVSCGNGVEVWQRTCDNPVPKYGGHNCSELGNSTETRNCSRKPCLINCNCGNWTKFSPCSVTCGQGVEIWTRRCDNLPKGFDGNCSKLGINQETRLCNLTICSGHTNFENIGMAVGVLFVIIAAGVCCISIRRRQCRHKRFPYYAVLNFSLQNLFLRNPQQPENNGNTSEEVTSSSHETGSTNEYENMLGDGIPIPAHSRGIIPYEGDYFNSRNSWYDKLRSIRPLAIDWLRNSWGNVDEFGRHVYDAMKRIRHIFVPYDKLKTVRRQALDGNAVRSSSSGYDTMERPPSVTLPSRSETVVSSATENI